jgi:hypothetical protein
MRRFWVGTALTALVVLSVAAGAIGATSLRKQIEVAYKDIKITVDGDKVATPDEPFLYVEKGRTFVPARPLAEAMGAKVGWDADTNTVLVYTKDYATAKRDGDFNIWSMPAGGFSLRAPKDFQRIQLPLALLQLNSPDPVTRTGSLVLAVQPMEGLSGTGSEKMAFLVYTLKETLLPEAKTTDVNEANGKTVAHGTAKYLGDAQVNFTLRIVSKGSTDWALIAISPAATAGQNQPMLDAVLDSFALNQ